MTNKAINCVKHDHENVVAAGRGFFQIYKPEMSVLFFSFFLFVGLLLSHTCHSIQVSLFPNGEKKICRNHTSNPSSITFTCNIAYSTLVWVFTYGKKDMSKVVTFSYGSPNTPVYLAVGAKAVIISQSNDKIASEFLVTVSEGSTPFKLSCGINFNKYQTFSLSYKETPGVPTNLHVRESIPNRDRNSLKVFFDWSLPVHKDGRTADIPDKYILYATTFFDAMYQSTEVQTPGGYLTLQPHIEYMVVVQSVNCAGYSPRASIIIHLDDNEARLPEVHRSNSSSDSQFKVVAHKKVMVIEFPDKGMASSNIITSFKDKILGLAGVKQEQLFVQAILIAPVVLLIIAVVVVAIISFLFLCTCQKMRSRYSKISFKDFEEGN